MATDSTVARRLLAGNRAVARTFEQMERYANQWRAANERALRADGPLWVVLGDSAALGVGASAYDRGYVGVVHAELSREDRWRVLNLAVSGVGAREVLQDQVPLLADLGRPDLVTALVGGNDLISTPLPWWLRDIDDLAAALPAGSVLGTVPQGFRERKARRGNDAIRRAALDHGHLVADVWARTGPPWRGAYADGMHPSERGYRSWASALTSALTSASGPQAVRYCR